MSCQIDVFVSRQQAHERCQTVYANNVIYSGVGWGPWGTVSALEELQTKVSSIGSHMSVTIPSKNPGHPGWSKWPWLATPCKCWRKCCRASLREEVGAVQRTPLGINWKLLPGTLLGPAFWGSSWCEFNMYPLAVIVSITALLNSESSYWILESSLGALPKRHPSPHLLLPIVWVQFKSHFLQ